MAKWINCKEKKDFFFFFFPESLLNIQGSKGMLLIRKIVIISQCSRWYCRITPYFLYYHLLQLFSHFFRVSGVLTSENILKRADKEKVMW